MRIIILTLSILLTGCASIPGMPGHLTTTVSTYDDSKSITMKPAFLLTSTGDVAVSFGMYWNSKIEKNTVIMTVRVAKAVSIDNGKSLNFNVNGELFSFEPIDLYTMFNRDPSIVTGGVYIPGTNWASKRYVIPSSFMDKINTAKSVKVRVELSTSYVEANYIWSAPSSIKSSAVSFMKKIRG